MITRYTSVFNIIQYSCLNASLVLSDRLLYPHNTKHLTYSNVYPIKAFNSRSDGLPPATGSLAGGQGRLIQGCDRCITLAQH